MCLIIRRSVTKHIMKMFLEETPNKENQSVARFLDWVSKIENRFAVFVLKSVWILLGAVETFRKGVSYNNKHYRNSGEKRMGPLLFLSNHYVYQRATLERDIRRHTLSPTLNKLEREREMK